MGELGPGDLEMLLLRLRMRKEGARERVAPRDLPGNPRGRHLRATRTIPTYVVPEL